MSETTVTGLVGVYHADGGPIGELRYLVGHMLGTTRCGLCDVTHSWRRKPEWDAMVVRLGIPFDLVHLNEMDAATADAVQLSGSPVVFTRTGNGLQVVLDADDLDRLDGSVAAFERGLSHRLETLRPPESRATRPGDGRDLPDRWEPRNVLSVRPKGRASGPEGPAPSSSEPPPI